MKRLAIVTTHPIQYYAPVFKLLASQCILKVFYTCATQASANMFDKDFGKKIAWDIPLLEGYDYEFLANSAKNPGSQHFWGINNPKIIKALESFQPDAILVYGWAYYSHLKIIRYFSGKISIWFRGDSTLIDEKPSLKKLFRKILLSWVYQHINKALYVGTANKAYFRAFGLKEKQLVFFPHAIDNNRFHKNQEEKAERLRTKLNIKPNDVVVLFAGKLEKKKDPLILLDAFLKLKSYNIHLLFVGNGKLENALKAKANTANASSKIHFLDFQNQRQMPTVYQACDLFCLPSKGPSETWGMAVNEAMAAGKAVLVSNKVGCSQDLISNKNGQIFCAEDVKDLAKSLAFLTQNRAKLEAMGIESKKTIQNWSFKIQITQILKLINAAE